MSRVPGPPPQAELALDGPSTDSAAPLLSLRLFGIMRATDRSGVSVLPRSRKCRALLALLALHGPLPVPRSRLVALLWSRRAPEQARASLRQALHELQSALGAGPSRLLRIGRGEIGIDRRGLATDAMALAEASAAPLLEDLLGVDPALDAWIGAEQARLAARARRCVEPDPAIGEVSEMPPTAALAEPMPSGSGQPDPDWPAPARIASEAGPWFGGFIGARLAMAEPRAAFALAEPEPADTGLAAPRIRPPYRGPRVGIAPLRVLPGGGPESGILAAGLTEELAVALSRFRGIACVPLGTGRPAPELDLVLDGAIQAVAGTLRVRVRLLDMTGGDIVWSVRFDRAIDNLLVLQEELAGAAVARLESHLLLWQERRRTGSEHPDAQRLLQHALPGLLRLDRAAFEQAGAALRAARELDPDHPGIHAWLAHWYLFSVGQGWAARPEGAADAMRLHLDQALGLDPEDARALSLSAHVRGFVDRDPAGAERLHGRALEANPNLPLAWSLAGLNDAYLGRHRQAIERAETAVRRSPQDPLRYFFDVALAVPLFLAGDDVASVRIGGEAIAVSPGFSSAYKTQLAALGHLGRREQAADIKARLLALEPGFTVSEALERSPIRDPAGRERYAEGLRLGGLA